MLLLHSQLAAHPAITVVDKSFGLIQSTKQTIVQLLSNLATLPPPPRPHPPSRVVNLDLLQGDCVCTGLISAALSHASLGAASALSLSLSI